MIATAQRNLVLVAAIFAVYPTPGCVFTTGGCPIDHSELTSIEPVIDCLNVKGNKSGGGQCVTASLLVENNCSDSLQFAAGWTRNGGKLTFAPGESGHYDALESMKTGPDLWETTATLGSVTIELRIKTHRR